MNTRRQPNKLSPAEAVRLIGAVAATRDRAAFALLFRYFAPRVKAYLLRLGGASAEAEEITQEAMLTVWRKAESFNLERAGAATWIFTVARNLWIDRLRRNSLARRLDLEAACESPDQADDLLIVAEREEQARMLLSNLSAQQARVIRAVFFEGKTHVETAAALSLPLGTVKSHARRAIVRLRALFGEEP